MRRFARKTAAVALYPVAILVWFLAGVFLLFPGARTPFHDTLTLVDYIQKRRLMLLADT